MIHVLDLIERHWRKAQRRWKKGSQLRDSGAANYDAFMHGEAVGQSKAYQYCAQWIKEYLHKEDEMQVTTEAAMAKLDEHINAAAKSWKGVEADKVMAEIREEDETATDCNELAEEVKSYFKGYWPGIETADQCNTDMHFTPLAIKRLAEHFYQLGLNARKKE